MIDVETLIRQIVPHIALLLGPVNRIDGGPRGRSCGIKAVLMARRPGPFPWLDEEEQQHGRKRYNKRGADHRRGSCLDGIRERIFKDVDPPTEKNYDDESGKAPECAREPAANDQGLGMTHARSVMHGPGAHGSILGRIPVSERWYRES